MTVDEHLEMLIAAIEKNYDPNDERNWYNADYLELVDVFKEYEEDKDKFFYTDSVILETQTIE